MFWIKQRKGSFPMKKLFVSLLFSAFIISFAMGIHAVEQQDSISYNYDELGVEVVFAGNTVFNQEQQQRIADILGNDIDPVESRSWCWLTGHTYVKDAVSVITHKASAYNPRCLEQTYKVTTCKKCNYYDEELLGSIYITCCPEE